MIQDTAMNQLIQVIHNPSFRKAFCLKPGFRFEYLRPYCEDIVFCTDGYRTDVEDIRSQLNQSFQHFDPQVDVIIPTGNGITNLMTGYLLKSQFPAEKINIAFFQKKLMKAGRVVTAETYVFYRLDLELMLQIL